MNTQPGHDQSDRLPYDDASVHGAPFNATPVSEGEWQLQERALREERSGHAPAPDDRELAAYRQVARALRQPPAGGLSADFAAQVADRVRQRASGPDPRVEGWLTHALLALMAGAGVLAFARYGGPAWLADARALLPPALLGNGLPWLLALGACLGLSWAIEPLRRGWSVRHPAGGR